MLVRVNGCISMLSEQQSLECAQQVSVPYDTATDSQYG
jgi:hypothetical protein